jgi:putative transposase
MDEAHILAPARCIELKPVRANLVARAKDRPWSSVRGHFDGKSGGIADAHALGIPPGQSADFLAAGLDDTALAAISRGKRTGRPLSDAAFFAR